MENTVTTKEISDFLDSCLNFEKKEKQERLYGKLYHDIRRYVYEDEIDYMSNTIYLNNNISKYYYIGGVNVDKNGFINFIQLDMCVTSKKNIKNNLYIGTDIDEELSKRFLGKKLIYENE